MTTRITTPTTMTSMITTATTMMTVVVAPSLGGLLVGGVLLLTWTVVVSAPTRLLVGCVLLTVVAIVPSVWNVVGIGAVNRKHIMSFHINSNKRHKEIRTSIELCYHETQIRCNHRASGNGTAGMAMAVPVFEGEKWRRLDSNLACVIECPLRALRRSLGRLRGL